jgi:hypothetical protein
MFPLPALVTPEPRPAERSVARRPGIVFTILAFFHTPPSCMSRKRRGLERAFKNPKNLGMPLLRHPPPPIGYEIVGNPRISSLKAV